MIKEGQDSIQVVTPRRSI